MLTQISAVLPTLGAIVSLGALSTLLGFTAKPIQPTRLELIGLIASWESPWVEQLTAADPVVESLVQEYVQTLGQDGWPVPYQGIWVQSGNAVIAQHQGDIPLSAASLTKLATTLAAIETWGPNYQFETRVGFTGSLQDGVVTGDLVVRGGSDPLFVWEEAIALGNALQGLGIQRVTGNLIVLGRFSMNYEEIPLVAGNLLITGLNREQWPREAAVQFGALPPGTSQPTLQIDGGVVVLPADSVPDVTWRLRHRSLPMVGLLKAMNIYSNNEMAERLAQTVGGAQAVMGAVNRAASLPPGEINLINGSGLGEENRISPRAVVAMLVALQDRLQQEGYSIADVLPISGEDIGTLIDRSIPVQAGVKTGSLAEVSALAGFVPTADRGPVWFAVINRGWALQELRAKQDKLLTSIQSHWGAAAVPKTFAPKVRIGHGAYRLGDPRRNQPI